MIPPGYPGISTVRIESQWAGATRCRVLVVEDDASSRRALVRLLSLRGFQTDFATTVGQAMEQLASAAPGCILLDLMLPDGNGVALLDYIRQRDLPIRVAVTTGAGNWQTLLNATQSRPDAVFTKPIDFNLVVDWLSQPA